MSRNGSGVYTAPSSSFNDAVTGTVIDPDAWNTLLTDIEAGLNFGTTGASDNRLLRSDGTGGLTVQSSAITVDDSGNMSGVGTLSLTSIAATTIDIGSSGTTLSEASPGLLAVEGVTVALISTAQTLTNKTIALGSNTISGTTAEFNTALSDNDFATLAGSETLSNKVLTLPQINDTSSDHQYVFAVSELAADRTVTLPLLASADTFVFEAHTQTLTNKTLTSPAINGTVTTSGLTLPAFTLGGTVSSNGQSFSGTLANLGTVTTADINGGTLDGAVIGGASAAAGTFTTLTANTSILPGSDGAVDLGSTTAAFNNLHLDTGATINVENGNAVITHSSGIFTVSTGDWRITTAGTNSASAVTVGGTQTLTAKTLTSPTITTSPTAAGATWTDLGTVTTADINGGTIDGSVIGGSSAAAGTFTTATANAFVPNSSSVPTNGMYLPAANTLGWAINSAAELQLTGTALSPAADGGSSLGTTALGWQNIFANTGFVLNIENSDWVATHTTGILTVGTGDLRITTAGTNSASAVTVGGTQTLTAKTLTSPVINTGTIGTSLLPTSNDGAALGATGTRFADLFLADGGVVDFGASGSRATITHTAASDSITIAADPDNATASTQIIFSIDGTNEAILDGSAFTPGANDGNALGTTSLGWADLHLATGALINVANGNAVITHSSGIFTVSTGDLRVTTAGTNSASVVTVGGTQTLTAKTLTSPTIGTSPTAAGATWTDLGTVTTADINGGTADAVVIGGSSAAAATVTTLSVGQTLAITGDISPAQITADQNNYNPTGLSTASAVRLDTDASRTITGLATGADGRLLFIHNVGAQDIVFANESASSTAGNRFAFGADLTLTADHGLLLRYDATDSRWYKVASSLVGAGGAGGAPDDAQYITAATNGTLTAERVATNTSSITWDFGTGGQAKADVVNYANLATTGKAIAMAMVFG